MENKTGADALIKVFWKNRTDIKLRDKKKILIVSNLVVRGQVIVRSQFREANQ